MGKKRKKTELLAEIIKKIEVCKKYQEVDPDPTAETRIKALEEDLCNDSIYYINVTLKDVLPTDVTTLSERKKHIKFKKILPLISDMEQFYCAGCVIIVTLNDENVPSFNVMSVGSFASIVQTLKSFYFNDNCYLAELRPRKSILGTNYIEDDIATASSNGKKMIVYGMARFNKTAVEDWLKERYTEEMSVLCQLCISLALALRKIMRSFGLISIICLHLHF